MAQQTVGGSKTYSYFILDPDTDEEEVYCFQDPDDLQTVATLREAKRLTAAHDTELAQATKDINAILAAVNKANKNPDRTLAFLKTGSGLFLAWTRYAGLGARDDEEKIDRALGLA